jgi:hypothetical protein
MPAKAGIQDFEKLNNIKNWIPAFAEIFMAHFTFLP